MDTKDIQERLRGIAEGALPLTDEAKAFVEEQSEALGLAFTKTACGNCYRDQALRLWSKLRRGERAMVENKVAVGGLIIDTNKVYALKHGNTLIIGGHYYRGTIRGSSVRYWKERGFAIEKHLEEDVVVKPEPLTDLVADAADQETKTEEEVEETEEVNSERLAE